jgi:hypothetical protein
MKGRGKEASFRNESISELDFGYYRNTDICRAANRINTLGEKVAEIPDKEFASGILWQKNTT